MKKGRNLSRHIRFLFKFGQCDVEIESYHVPENNNSFMDCTSFVLLIRSEKRLVEFDSIVIMLTKEIERGQTH